MKDSFFRRDFSLVVIGQIISIMGSAILRFALDLYVLDLTGRADIFAAVIALSAIPGILFTPIGGVIADRFSKRNLMVLFDFTSGAVVLLLFGLMSTGKAPVLVIGSIMAVLNVISSMYQPAVQASVPALVGGEQLAGANGIVNSVGALSHLLGPVLGGFLYGVIGIKMFVIISSAAFFLSAIMEIFIYIPFVKRKSEKSAVLMILSDTKDGFRYIANNNPIIIRIMLIAAALNLFLMPLFSIGLPYILRVTMNSNGVMYGIGLGITELASVTGALTVGLFMKNMKTALISRPLIIAAFLLLPMSASLFPGLLELGYWPSFILFFSFAVIFVAIMTMLSVFVITDVQKKTPDGMLGKVMAALITVSQIAAPLGQILYGGAFETFSAAVYIPFLTASVFAFAIAFTAKKILNQEESFHGKSVVSL